MQGRQAGSTFQGQGWGWGEEPPTGPRASPRLSLHSHPLHNILQQLESTINLGHLEHVFNVLPYWDTGILGFCEVS